jgi:sensor c-di-GMP phosphodiesterase-like protein
MVAVSAATALEAPPGAPAYPISGIKLDRMFTQTIGKEAMGSKIAENVCLVAKALNLQLIVEGIETEQQAEYIKELSPTAIGQGWLYGKPVPADGR